MSELIRFQPKAYCKLILHAAKYPHCAVNGLLLAEKAEGKELCIVDAIPMFHLCLNLVPMAEIALTQIDSYAIAEGLTIAGYYMANENLYDISVDKPATKIADKIYEMNPSACVVVIDNSKMTLTMDDPAIIVMTNTEGKWQAVENDSYILDEASSKTAGTLLCDHIDKYLVDFDNHLDDISKDWRNPALNEEIKKLIE